jgi:hypothetical protein
MFEATIVAPSARPVSETDTPRPRRSRAKRLTTVNRSTRLGKRIDELKALFTETLGEDALTPMRRMRIAEAAELKAGAEVERGKWMRGEARCDLDELVRLERKADQAVRSLGLTDAKPKSKLSVPEYLALRDARISLEARQLRPAQSPNARGFFWRSRG